MPGRPKKANADRKTNVLRIRLTPEERKIIDSAARATSLLTATWARMTLLAEARTIDKEKTGT